MPNPQYEVQYGDLDAALKAAGVAFDQLGPSEQPPAEETPPPADAAAPADPATPAAEEVAPEPAPEQPSTPDPKLQALIDREARIVEREQALTAAQSHIDSLQQRLDAFEAAQRRFKISPAAYIRALAPDVDFDDVARQLWYEKLGSAAPPEFRVHNDARTAQLEVQQLRTELEERDKRIAEEKARMDAERVEAQFVDGLKAYAATVPDKYQLVQSLAKQKPDVAVGMMHDAARMLAPSLQRVPTNEEIAKAVNEYLDRIGYVAPAQAPAADSQAQPTEPEPTAPPSTIRNSHVAVQPSLTPPSADDKRVLRRRAYEAMAAATGNPNLASLPVEY